MYTNQVIEVFLHEDFSIRIETVDNISLGEDFAIYRLYTGLTPSFTDYDVKFILGYTTQGVLFFSVPRDHFHAAGRYFFEIRRQDLSRGVDLATYNTVAQGIIQVNNTLMETW